MISTLEKRFWDKVSVSDGCWTWLAARNNHGYGVIRDNSKNLYAHRLSYELHKGQIPGGLVVDHLCGNASCVNPDHLDAVPQRTNILRGRFLSVIRSKRLSRTHCRLGHELTDINTKIKQGKYRVCRACFNKNRKDWRTR